MKHDWPEWIDRIGKDDVTEQELRDFQNALNESPENSKEYMQALFTEAALEIEHDHAAPQVRQPLQQPTQKPSWKRRALPIAASAALLIGLAYLIGRQSTPTPAIPDTSATVASITDTNKAADAAGIRIGQLLQAGEFSVPEGAEIGIAMRGGARLKINGPASLRLDDPDTVFLHKGRIQTYAPEYAHGFAINTDEGEIIDLGTRFVTTTGGDLGTEIHVIEGLVKAKATSDKKNTFFIGGEQAGTLQGGSMASTDYLSQRFHIPINPNLPDSDGDSVPDTIEAFYKTDANNPTSTPDILRIAESFSGYQTGKINDDTKYLGKGDITHWLGHGTFLKQGLNYQHNGKTLTTSGGCIQTTGHGGEGATILLDNNTLPSEGTIYISFLMQQPVNKDGRKFSGLLLYLYDYNEQLFVGDLGDVHSYGSRFAKNERQDAFAIPADGKPHLFVIRIDKTRYLTDIYIDPHLNKPEKDAFPQRRYQSVPRFDRIQVRSGNSFPVRFDEIRVGLTWDSVLPTDK